METDVLIAGAGPAGSTLAALLAKRGAKVILVEKNEFPRFKIGESLLPHSLDVLRESGALDKIDTGKYIRKYGAQFIDYREEEQVYFDFANALDDQHPYAFEVDRSEFDQDLLLHAKDCGAQVLQPCSVTNIDEKEDHILAFAKNLTIKAKYFVDATGKNALLANSKKLRRKNPLFNHVAVFSHYKNIPRKHHRREGDIIIGILPNNSWSWHIPFQGEVTSVGIVTTAGIYRENKDNSQFIEESLGCHPVLEEMMKAAQRIRPLEVTSNYSFSSSKMIGERWATVGDAASFLDPVFSSGVHIALKSAQLLSGLLLSALAINGELTPFSQGYETELKKGILRFEDLLNIFYKTPFVQNCRKIEQRPLSYQAMTSAVGGDMWNDDNPLFRFNAMPGMINHAQNLSL